MVLGRVVNQPVRGFLRLFQKLLVHVLGLVFQLYQGHVRKSYWKIHQKSPRGLIDDTPYFPMSFSHQVFGVGDPNKSESDSFSFSCADCCLKNEDCAETASLKDFETAMLAVAGTEAETLFFCSSSGTLRAFWIWLRQLWHQRSKTFKSLSRAFRCSVISSGDR